MNRAILGSASTSSRLLSSTCSCSATTRSFSLSSPTFSLPPPLPLHAHPSSVSPASSLSEPSALSLLASQPSHYVSALLQGRRYLLTPNDILTVPKLKGLKPGDTIALTRILEVGSRDYTLRAAVPEALSLSTSASSSLLNANKVPILSPASSRSVLRDGVPRDWQRHPDSLPYLKEGVVKATVTVLEHTKGRMFEVEKFKRRKGYRRLLRSKLAFTKLRVGGIEIGSGEA